MCNKLYIEYIGNCNMIGKKYIILNLTITSNRFVNLNKDHFSLRHFVIPIENHYLGIIGKNG